MPRPGRSCRHALLRLWLWVTCGFICWGRWCRNRTYRRISRYEEGLDGSDSDSGTVVEQAPRRRRLDRAAFAQRVVVAEELRDPEPTLPEHGPLSLLFTHLERTLGQAKERNPDPGYYVFTAQDLLQVTGYQLGDGILERLAVAVARKDGDMRPIAYRDGNGDLRLIFDWRREDQSMLQVVMTERAAATMARIV